MNRVVLQHMSVNIMDNVIVKDSNYVSLSPPSESLMLQRRNSLQKGQSLQLNRLNNNIKVLSIQVGASLSLINLSTLLTVYFRT